MEKKRTVMVGMSGGVDSSVSALLLKNQGYDVIGLFMKNWEEEGSCNAINDFEDVVRVCDHIGIPYYSVNFVKEYWDRVFSEFLSDLQKGLTPNPDVLCNREIKFKAFYEKALALEAHFIATGHFCQTMQRDGSTLLLRGNDPDKDQSYFLYAVSEKVLANVFFPVGHLHKTEVRRIATEHKIPTAEKKNSTGICFIGKRNFRPFLHQFLPYTPGKIENSSGKVVGDHPGVAYFTLGQRKGLKIGGPGDAYFVVAKDLERNVLIVEQGQDHAALFSKALVAENPSWIAHAPSNFPFACTAKIRYRQSDQACHIVEASPNTLRVVFDEPQRAVTPGQAIVFYQDNVCLGGAKIIKSLKE